MTGDAPAGIYNVSDGDTRSGNWFARTVAGFANLSAPSEISVRQAELDWSEERLSFATESRRLDNQKMRAVLGVNLRYANAEEGIRASLADEAIQSRK